MFRKKAPLSKRSGTTTKTECTQGSNCAIPKDVKFKELGPYKDTEHRALRYGPRRYGYNAKTCAKATKGYKYFALQHNGCIGYHISLLNLLAACCRGKATLEEVRCKSLFRFDDMVNCIVNPKTIWAVKLPMLMLLYDAYLEFFLK